MTAHELARKLLAGGDYPIVVGDDVTEHVSLEITVKTVPSLHIADDAPTVAAILIEAQSEGGMGWIA